MGREIWVIRKKKQWFNLSTRKEEENGGVKDDPNHSELGRSCSRSLDATFGEAF